MTWDRWTWLLIAVVRRESFFDRRVGVLLIEDLLLAWTAAIILVTYSRLGLVVLFVQVGLTILIGTGPKKTDRPGAILRILAPENLKSGELRAPYGPPGA